MSKTRIIINKIMAIFIIVFFYLVTVSVFFQKIDLHNENLKIIEKEYNTSCFVASNGKFSLYRLTPQCEKLSDDMKNEKVYIKKWKKLALYYTVLYFGVFIFSYLLKYVTFKPVEKLYCFLKDILFSLVNRVREHNVFYFRITVVLCLIYILFGAVKYNIWNHYYLSKFILYYLIPAVLLIGIVWIISATKNKEGK
ncbi:hypothetical protein [Caminibacter pacificus]|uniref:Uncharacterized protein n=1 Tax=Caminibacter pacificus TaxID=1424653 RepID=A0AAJ4RED6_9BACT|nr:hypothetical protein [Caminibacter pacificus]QCI28265.1 hypothetical protein C6V80_04625 [Caminibacter pacificus]ROR41020.1 hypothetical protein EDC58_0504 [Caminibacter pacificus]